MGNCLVLSILQYIMVVYCNYGKECLMDSNIKTQAAFKKRMQQVVKRENNLRDDYHGLAVLALSRYQEYGDSSWMSTMVNCMSEFSGYRSCAITWFKRFGMVKTGDADDGIKFTKVKGSDWSEVDVAAADAVPFWTVNGKIGQEYRDFDLQSELKKLLGRYESIVSGEEKATAKIGKVTKVPESFVQRLLDMSDKSVKKEVVVIHEKEDAA